MASLCSHDFVCSWLSSALIETHFPPTPPQSDTSPRPSKRKHANSMPMTTSGRASPKRRRTEQEDEVSPAQSASQIGRSNPFDLTNRTTLSAVTNQSGISSPKRPASPTREASTKLKTSIPAIAVSPISGLREKPPEPVRRLRDTLSNGFEIGFIPSCLEEAITNDEDLGWQDIEPSAFDRGDKRTFADLCDTLQEVKQIYTNARTCSELGRDENAWCIDVVQPLVRLALKLHGNGKWWFQSVQSQTINPQYLSLIPSPLSSNPDKLAPIERKTDFVFSYSHLPSPGFESLYDRLKAANNAEVGHTTDTFTKRTVLFSGIKVKSTSGDKAEAELQMSIWMAASLRKKAELAKRVAFNASLRGAEANISASKMDIDNANREYQVNSDDVHTDDEDGDAHANNRNPNAAGDKEDARDAHICEAQPVADVPPIPATLPEPALTIVGHEHYIYYAYLDSAADIHILGPDIDRFGNVSTRSIRGIFALLRLYGRVLEYGIDERGFGGQLLGRVLEALAVAADR